MSTRHMSTAEFIEEFQWTWIRHGGRVSLAAEVFQARPEAIARRLARAKAKGIEVTFIDDKNRTP